MRCFLCFVFCVGGFSVCLSRRNVLGLICCVATGKRAKMVILFSDATKTGKYVASRHQVDQDDFAVVISGLLAVCFLEAIQVYT